ncbi:EVE domain-containing protein [Bacillus vallismortis]|uniref:EVE domain-containing protein n=1 Tax=Bacillus vallismortis TaxID=72361 RepID=UPI002E14EC18
MHNFAMAKKPPLKRMNKGDWIIYYSPKVNLKENTPCQTFTALGKVVDHRIFQFDMENDFQPFRRHIHFIHSTEIPIRPLLPYLSFIKDEKRWGCSFRFGHFEISEKDFQLIAQKMVDGKGD